MKCWVRSARRDSTFPPGLARGFCKTGKLGRASIHFLLLALLAGGALSQETTFHTQSNVVVIPALVKSAKGEIVYGLTAKDFLVEKGYDPQYGARPMRRSVERFLEDPLAEEILKGNLHEGEPILVTAANDKLVFNQKAAATGAVAS